MPSSSLKKTSGLSLRGSPLRRRPREPPLVLLRRVRFSLCVPLVARVLLGVGVVIPSFDVVFFNDTATTEIYPLSLHDALPICCSSWIAFSRSCLRYSRLAELTHCFTNRATSTAVFSSAGTWAPLEVT